MEIAAFIPTLLFYIFAGLTLGSALGVILSKNPVHSVLFLIFAFFNSAGLFLLIGAEYIAMTLIIVYVGAVAVLFLFVVMMLDINIAEMREGFIRNLPLGIIVATALLVEFVLVFMASLKAPSMVSSIRNVMPEPEEATNTEAIGQILYTDYFYPFQIAGLILLVAMIGAIVLTHRTRPGVRKQRIPQQLARKREDAVEVITILPGQGGKR